MKLWVCAARMSAVRADSDGRMLVGKVIIYLDNAGVEVKFDRAAIAHEPRAAFSCSLPDEEILRIDRVHTRFIFDYRTAAVLVSGVPRKAAEFSAFWLAGKCQIPRAFGTFYLI